MAGLAAAAILSASPEGGNAAHAFLAPGAPGLFTREAGSGLNSAAAAGRRATCASRACSGLKAQVGDGEANTLEEYKRRLKEVDALEGAPRAKRQAPDEGGGGLFGKLFAKKAKGCQTDYDCNEGGRNWPLRCVDVIFTKVCVDKDDSQGGMGIQVQAALVPIPVRVDDGYTTQPGQPGWPGGRDY